MTKMKGKTIVKKITLYASMATLLLVLSSSSINRKNKDIFKQKTKINKNRIEYNSGVIYIGDNDYLESIKNLNRNDVLVLDDRMNDKDPNVRIYNSYKINIAELREEIIESLLLYEAKYPTNWNRTKNSMMREWSIHNYMYQVGYKINSTTDVDLNNNDEISYRLRKKFFML